MAATSPTTAIPLLAASLLLCMAGVVHAQTSSPKALEAVRAAVASELAAARNDHSNWIFLNHETTPAHQTVYLCVGSVQGELRYARTQDGKPVSAEAHAADVKHVQDYINDPGAQAKARKNAVHDDQQATQLIKMLPDAFIWQIVSDTPQLMTLSYTPNPAFDGPDMEARVMGTMQGEMSITHPDNRIRTLKGSLSQDFRIGFGMLGKLYKGGTFDIERREVAPGFWEITEQRVHIGGHALLFKTIGQQQDEIKTDWRPSPAKTLQEAVKILDTEK